MCSLLLDASATGVMKFSNASKCQKIVGSGHTELTYFTTLTVKINVHITFLDSKMIDICMDAFSGTYCFKSIIELRLMN